MTVFALALSAWQKHTNPKKKKNEVRKHYTGKSVHWCAQIYSNRVMTMTDSISFSAKKKKTHMKRPKSIT